MTHLLGTRSRSTSWRASPRALSKRPAPLATWTQNHNKHLRYQPHTRCLPPSIPELSKTFASRTCCSAVSSELATVSSPLSVAAHPYHVASHLELPHLLQRIATRTRLLNFHIATAQHHTIEHVLQSATVIEAAYLVLVRAAERALFNCKRVKRFTTRPLQDGLLTHHQ